ncbi:MAG: hypothetical protein MI824_21335 [Hyphomicrobiales bacterium]|nr:hypothetical protein [Hyphomicrobiales bacterium]
MPSNDLNLVRLALGRLGETGSQAVVAGGWARELLGLCAPCAHSDIDLLFLDTSFDAVDGWLARKPQGIVEIAGKRFAHKRAFTLRDTMVEFILVERDAMGSVTYFWGDVPYRWIEPLTVSVQAGSGNESFSVISPENLAHFEAQYATLQPWRWREPGSLVARPNS